MSTRGLKDYLIYFFSNFVLSDFKQTFEGVQIESAKFVPGLLDGSLLTYLLIPGGTMFGDRVPQLSADRVPVAKRGNLLFVRNGHIFVISIELAERVIEGRSYSKTTAEEDEILRNRLTDIVSKIAFAKPPAPEPSGNREEVRAARGVRPVRPATRAVAGRGSSAPQDLRRIAARERCAAAQRLRLSAAAGAEEADRPIR